MKKRIGTLGGSKFKSTVYETGPRDLFLDPEDKENGGEGLVFGMLIEEALLLRTRIEKLEAKYQDYQDRGLRSG